VREGALEPGSRPRGQRGECVHLPSVALGLFRVLTVGRTGSSGPWIEPGHADALEGTRVPGDDYESVDECGGRQEPVDGRYAVGGVDPPPCVGDRRVDVVGASCELRLERRQPALRGRARIER
jgi:hypothetical protein